MFKQSSSASGLCVAMILTASLTVQSFPLTRSRIVFDVKGNLNQPGSPQQQSAPATGAQKPSAPKTDSQSGPAPAVGAPIITATLRDNGWPAFPGAASPGNTVTYTAVISNTGTADATGVTFNDIINANTSTLFGVPTLSSVLVKDTYSSIGNVGIDTANIGGVGQSVLDNDTITGGETLSKFASTQATLTGGGGTVANGTNTITTANSGIVKLRVNGTFTYDPAAGFTGADTFSYAVDGATGIATAQVTINVSAPIWFINAGAAGTNVGTLANPFNGLTGGAGTFSNVNDGGAGHPKDNETVFMYTGAYTGGLTPRNGQKLVGQGASASLASIAGVTLAPESNALPATAGVNPTVTSVANGINLGVGFSNTLRGFTIGNTPGFFKIASGASFGTLTVSEVLLNGTGGDLSLTSGALAATFTSITSLSSATRGISLSSITGSLTTNGTTISGNTERCIIVSGSTVTADFGNTSCTGGSDGVTLQNNSSGTRTFGTLNVSGASGNAFLHFAGGGNATITGAATLSSALTAFFVSSPGGTDVINFQAATSATSTTATQTGVNWTGTAGASLTFNSLTIQTNGGTGLNATTGGTINVTNATGTINNTTQAAPAIVADTVTLNANFASIKSSGGTNPLSLTNVSGTSNLGGGALSGNTSDVVRILNGTGSVSYSGTITNTGPGKVVLVQTKTGSGTVNFSGLITDASAAPGQGILMTGNSAGTTVNFSGGMNISTTTNSAFAATGGGTVTATQNNTTIVNTISSTTGTALNVANTTIGASGLTFQSISSNGGTASGIVLDTTGSTGGLTVTGDGTNTTKGGNATGGTIANKDDGGTDNSGTVGTGIFLNNTSNVTLRRMQLNDLKNNGVRGLSVTGFTLQYSTINGANGDTVTGPEGSVAFGTSNPGGANGLLGSGLIDNCKISGAIEHNMEFYSQSGTLNALTISNTDVKSNSVASGSDGIQIEMQGTASATVSIQSCVFDDNKSQAVQAAANDSSTIDITINLSTVQRTTQGNEGFVLSNGSNGHLTAHVTNNTMSGLGGAMIFVGQTPGNATTSSLLTAVIKGNTITHPTTATNHAIIAFLSSTVGQVSSANILIDSNNVTENSTGGVSRAIIVDTPDTSTTPSFTATVTSNTVSVGDNVAGVVPIAVNARKNSAGCFDIRSNTATFPNGTPAGVNGVRARQADSATAQLEPGAGAGTAASALATNNPGSTTEVLGTVTLAPNNTTCLTAPTIAQPDDQALAPSATQINPPATATSVQPARFTDIMGSFSRASVSRFASFDIPTLPVQAAQPQSGEIFVAPRRLTNDRQILRGISPRVSKGSDALSLWERDGVRAYRSVSSVPSPPTPLPKVEGSKAEIREANHAQRSEVRNQRSEAKDQKSERKANHATRTRATSDDKPVTPTSGGTVSLGPFGLNVGSSVTIIFQVTINTAQPLPHTSISNQGTVAGTNFTSVNGVLTTPNTDDPDTGAAADPTITPITGVSAATSTVSGRIVDDNGSPVEGAVIRLNGTQNRKTITDTRGNYSFAEVETNGFYTVTPSRVNYNFAPSTRGFSALGAQTEASFASAYNGNHLNPLDTTEYFVRQQYVDFLGREPEEKGFNDWTDTINNCAPNDTSCDRVHVSEMFFRSEEFQQRGYFIYRFYSAALGRKPDYVEFAPDMARVSGFLDATQLEAAKTQFANDYVNRPAFASQYGTLSNSAYVDALAAAAGVTLSNRQALVASLEAGTLTRAQALRQIAESGEVYAKYYNQAFVVMEYFGYLRRDPDILYLNWISVLDQGGDSRHMVEGFVDATEYRNRFKQ